MRKLLPIVETQYRGYTIRPATYYNDYGAWFARAKFAFYENDTDDNPCHNGWADSETACKSLIDEHLNKLK